MLMCETLLHQVLMVAYLELAPATTHVSSLSTQFRQIVPLEAMRSEALRSLESGDTLLQDHLESVCPNYTSCS